MPEENAPVNVLLIEDNPYDVKLITEYFRDIKDANFSLTFVQTLKEAAGTGSAAAPDVILLDLNLPDSAGPDTLGRVEALFPDVPVIVMTGFYEESLGLELIKKGAQDYLVKGKITGEWIAYSIRYSIERARIERRIKQRENRLRDILEKSPDGFLVVREDGRVLFSNRGAQVILGGSREELLKRPFTLESSTDRIVETELRLPEGRKIPLEIRAVNIAWNAETCRMVILRDLTAVRSLERHRDEFISMISHELRSPLTVVKESLSLVFDGAVGEVTARQKEVLDIGMQNVSRLNRLIDALLDITKIEAGLMPMDISRTDLGGLLAVTASEYAFLGAERGIAVAKELPSAPLVSYCDGERVREVIINLVSNALKFTPQGGIITLSARPWEGEALLCVENSGPGIEEENLPRLFNKFAQLGGKRQSGTKGTGLGLAISKGIVEMHSGKIWVESQPGKGCKFYVLLPVMGYAAALEHVVRRELEAGGGRKRGFCVLTLALPPEVRKESPAAARLLEKTETFLREKMRAAHAVLKSGDGEFAFVLSNLSPQEGYRTCSFLNKSISALAGLDPAADLTFLLAFPEDFTDAGTYFKKLAAKRERINEKDTAD